MWFLKINIHLTFHSLLVKELGEADRDVWIGQVRVPLPLYSLAQRPAVVQQEALLGEVDWQSDDECQEEEDEEEPEEKVWRQIVPPDTMNLGDGGIVVQPLVGQVDHAFESGPENEQLKLNSNLRSLITLLLQMRTTKIEIS